MSGLKRDAMACRRKASSEQIRLSLGQYTPAERQAQAEAETRRKLAAKKKAAQGKPLGLEEE